MSNTLPVSIAPLFCKRLLLVAGKGGVGRTTIAAGLAWAAAQQGKRVLFAQTKSINQIASLFETNGSFETIQPVHTNLWAVYVTPETALLEYATLTLRSAFVARQFVERETIRSFLSAVPGLPDYAMLGKIWYHTTEFDNGSPRYDLLVVDAPATGHLISMLQIPQAIARTLPQGPLQGPAQACWALLTSPKDFGCVLVTLPEELPVAESCQLAKRLHALGMPPGVVVVNQLQTNPWSSPPFPRWLHTTPQAPIKELQPLWHTAWHAWQQSQRQQACVAQLHQELAWPHIHVPSVLPTSRLVFQVAEHLHQALLQNSGQIRQTEV